MEQTFFIIKPDGVKRGLVGEVLKRIEQRGLTIEKLELRTKVSEELIDQHYQDLVGQSFYPPIREFMTSGPYMVQIQKSQLSEKLLFGLTESSKGLM